ncbi:MAG: multiheme c-type cytochrome [candidate division KSB1 bacterium]|nr:multiheme c-type cytochrome [candidate division KSB1 bacterium]MDZ7341067.1 multiheme c-type cytochrome [candidate division KSB1 bacterium]
MILDAGDFVSSRGKKEQLKTEFLLKAMSQMKYDAIALGERDFLHGIDFLVEAKKKYNLPLICANVFQADGKTPLFEPYIIKELPEIVHGNKRIPSLRVGILSVMLYRSQLVFDNDPPPIIMGNPVEAAQQVLEQIKDRCDVIIGLIHLPYAELNKLIQQVSSIDVVIAGHDPMMYLEPQTIGKTLIIAGGSKGQYIGDLRLILNGQKKIIDHEGKVVNLNEQFKDDPSMLKLLEEYREREAALTIEINREQYRAMKMFVGAEACRKCHADQYDQWKKTGHATAFQRLQKEGMQEAMACLQCHTTGFAQYNGFYSIKETPEMANVQCESCHGIGQLHVQSIEKMKSGKLRAAILSPITEETCLGCHTAERDPDFQYTAALGKVKHGAAAKAKK